MVNINKTYKKAMDLYCDGRLDKALNYCDKVLNKDRSHSPTLNLKGLIYYIRGQLEEAKTLWKLSYKLNGDMVSKKYLDDSRHDEGDVYIFSQGVHLFNEFKVKDALKCFLKCESSHFNSINLWKYIAKCHMQLGQHNKAVKYIEDILTIDKHNPEALSLKKQLIELNFIPKETRVKFKKFMVVLGTSIVAVCIVLLIGIGIFKGYNKTHQWLQIKQEKKNEAINKDKTNLDNFQGNSEKIEGNSHKESESDEIKKEIEKNESSNIENESFNVSTLKSYVKAKDYENIIKYIEKYDIEGLSINDRNIAQNAVTLIKEKGVLSLYENGVSYIADKKYDNAIKNFTLVYKYSEGMYLNEHILFMMASSYEGLEDIENANKYYEIYVDKYEKNGSYIEQCLYSLAINNEGIDKEKSKKYAKILTNRFSKSEYNNSRIKAILK